jgi:NAD(P)-dependent dehydrogenase (short-subunit alcohol dehydrogenase family)
MAKVKKQQSTAMRADEPLGTLYDKVAVVTGGGGGIGSAICRALAHEGARVAVCDSRLDAAAAVAAAIKENGSTAEPWSFDVADRREVEKAASDIERSLGELSIWVNNAGVSKIVAFLDCSDEVWNQTLAVNLTGAFNGCQAAIRRMLPRRRGAIINMSSQSGKTGNSHYAAYCASKFGVIGLTQSLAIEFAREGIRINAVCPGVVFTPLWEGMVDDYARKRKMKPEDVRPYLEAKIPIGRLCAPEDVARTVVFLAGDDAGYITGQAINLAGGAEMH